MELSNEGTAEVIRRPLTLIETNSRFGGVMVETREREKIYTTMESAGPSTALVVLFSLLIVAVLGFMVYFFSNNELRNAPPTVIERDTQTNVPIPITAPTAPPPAPNINILPNNNASGEANPGSSGTDETNTPNSTPGGQSPTP
jgi:hypothetical protein